MPTKMLCNFDGIEGRNRQLYINSGRLQYPILNNEYTQKISKKNSGLEQLNKPTTPNK